MGQVLAGAIAMNILQKLDTFLDQPCECPEDVAELRLYLTDSRYAGAVSYLRDWERRELGRQAGL